MHTHLEPVACLLMHDKLMLLRRRWESLFECEWLVELRVERVLSWARFFRAGSLKDLVGSFVEDHAWRHRHVACSGGREARASAAQTGHGQQPSTEISGHIETMCTSMASSLAALAKAKPQADELDFGIGNSGLDQGGDIVGGHGHAGLSGV